MPRVISSQDRNDVLDNKQIRGSIRGFGSVLAYDFEDLGLENRDILKRLNSLQIVFSNGEDSYTNGRSEEHTSELQSRGHLVCHLLLEKKSDPSEDTDFRPDQFNELLHLAGVVYSQLQDSRPLRILYGCAAHNGGEPRQRIQVAGRIAR